MKKNILLMILIAFLAINANAQQGIKFEKASWKKVLAKAKVEKKNDFYGRIYDLVWAMQNDEQHGFYK